MTCIIQVVSLYYKNGNCHAFVEIDSTSYISCQDSLPLQFNLFSDGFIIMCHLPLSLLYYLGFGNFTLSKLASEQFQFFNQDKNNYILIRI